MHCNDWHVRLSKQTALEVFLRNDIMAVIRGVLQKRIFYGQTDRKGREGGGASLTGSLTVKYPFL